MKNWELSKCAGIYKARGEGWVTELQLSLCPSLRPRRKFPNSEFANSPTAPERHPSLITKPTKVGFVILQYIFSSPLPFLYVSPVFGMVQIFLGNQTASLSYP